MREQSLEEEFLSGIHSQNTKALSGLIKFGGFSTVVRSILIPSLKPLILENPEIQVEFLTRELHELPALLESGAADFLLINRPYKKNGVENIELGFEEYVLVEPKDTMFRENVYLDHDSNDTTTIDFFKLQDRPPKKRKRSYFDEIYTLIDGVLAGAGRAVIPVHLARQYERLKVCKGFRSMKVPVFFCFYRQPFYTSLQKQVINKIKENVPKLLKSKG